MAETERRLPEHARIALAIGAATSLVTLAGSFLFGDETSARVSIVDGVETIYSDGAVYRLMAERPGEPILAPFDARPLIPRLVHLSGLPTLVGFRVAAALLTGVAVASMFLLVARRHPTRRAVAATVLFAATYPVASALRAPFVVDPVAHVVIASGLCLLAARRWWWLAALLVVGAMGRETAAYMVLPMLAVLLWERRRPQLAACIALAAPVVGQLLARAPGVFYADGLTFGPTQGPDEVLPFVFARHGGPIGSVVWGSIGAFGMAGVLALLGWRRSPTEPRLYLALLLPCAMSLLIASDWSRLLGFALPAVVLVAAFAGVPNRALYVCAAVDLTLTLLMLSDLGSVELPVMLVVTVSMTLIALRRVLRSTLPVPAAMGEDHSPGP